LNDNLEQTTLFNAGNDLRLTTASTGLESPSVTADKDTLCFISESL